MEKPGSAGCQPRSPVRIPAFAAVPLALLLLVAGCSAAPGDTTSQPGDSSDPASDGCVPVAAGAASDAVTVDDTDPTAPVAQFATPLSVAETQRTVLAEGDGELVGAGAAALVDFSIFTGGSGELAGTTGHGTGATQTLLVDQTQTLPGFVLTVECAHVGDRIVSVVAPADAYGDEGRESLGIGPGETVVIVLDVVDLYSPPIPAEWTDAPEVDFGATPPTFTLAGAPATELLAHTIVEGDGPVVSYGQSVTVNYLGKSWDTGEVFDESYTSEPRSFSTSGVVTGFSSAIVGHTVGSTVIVTMPPELGYGTDPAAHELGGQTLVFVVEIIDAAS